MEKIISEGRCHFCVKTFKKAGINRHLSKHLSEKFGGAPGKSYHLKIEADPSWGRTPYFLSLWINGKTKMGEPDDFLRKIWLECCGHLSSFVIPQKRSKYGRFDFFEAEELFESGKIKEYEADREGLEGKIPMGRISEQVFHKHLKIEYEYDYGSTTALLLTVLGEYPMAADESIVLLSRNEPLGICCESCGKRSATQICASCYDCGTDALFCEKCAKKHQKNCEDFYGTMPVVNSPRMGVCGYHGGTIDQKRDGN